MEFTIKYSPVDEIITVTLRGEATIGALAKMFNVLAEKITETKSLRVLVDVLALDHHMSLIEMISISGMIQSVSAGHDIDLTPIRRAMVSTNSGRMMELYEVVAKYVGGEFKRFQTVEEAKKWLTE
jgi:hypothetical protein